jgi:hypothetical protein
MHIELVDLGRPDSFLRDNGHRHGERRQQCDQDRETPE